MTRRSTRVRRHSGTQVKRKNKIKNKGLSLLLSSKALLPPLLQTLTFLWSKRTGIRRKRSSRTIRWAFFFLNLLSLTFKALGLCMNANDVTKNSASPDAQVYSTMTMKEVEKVRLSTFYNISKLACANSIIIQWCQGICHTERSRESSRKDEPLSRAFSWTISLNSSIQ